MMENEEKDLVELKAEIQAEKIRCVNAQIAYLSYKEDDLRSSGHKSIAAAQAYRLQAAKTRIEKLTKDYLKKYPD